MMQGNNVAPLAGVRGNTIANWAPACHPEGLMSLPPRGLYLNEPKDEMQIPRFARNDKKSPWRRGSAPKLRGSPQVKPPLRALGEGSGEESGRIPRRFFARKPTTNAPRRHSSPLPAEGLGWPLPLARRRNASGDASGRMGRASRERTGRLPAKRRGFFRPLPGRRPSPAGCRWCARPPG